MIYSSDISGVSVPGMRAILCGDTSNTWAARYPIKPWNSPGAPQPGPNFRRLAEALATDDDDFEYQLHGLYTKALYSDGRFRLPVATTGGAREVAIVPGHLQGGAVGPQSVPSPRVMVIGKAPGVHEESAGRNFVGPSGQLLRELLEEAGVSCGEYGSWYFTNVVRWRDFNPSRNALPRDWIKDCAPLLWQEMALFWPEYVLCLGAEALRAVIADGSTLQSMIGEVRELPPVAEEQPAAKLVALTHPARVLRDTARRPQLQEGVRGFVSLVHGEQPRPREEEFDICIIEDEEALAQLVDEILEQPGVKRVAVDAEWQGQFVRDPGSYLRTIQISHKPKFGAAVVLRHAGGAPAFTPGIERAIYHLKRLLDRDDVQIIGHYFAADMPWLKSVGLDISRRYTCPDNLSAMYGGRYPGGFDTALAAHAVNETADFKLEVMAVEYCGAKRYDAPLRSWVKEHAKSMGVKLQDLEGYGECPKELLYPYGALDAAYTRELAEMLSADDGPLYRDSRGNNCWRAFQISMQAYLGFCEIHETGLYIDLDRLDEMTDLFMAARDRMLASLRVEINWPDFNPGSDYHCRELMFGEWANQRQAEDGTWIKSRPDGAASYGLTPVKTTGTRSKEWQRVVADGEEHMYKPSADKEVLGILSSQCKPAGKLRDIRFLNKQLTSMFYAPARNEQGELLEGEDGRRIYAGGIVKNIRGDGRVHSRIYPTLETGRTATAAPNSQNWSNRREDDYERMLGADYIRPIRSIMAADPFGRRGEPYLLIEADYKGAELFATGVAARDVTLLEHSLRNNLPEDHPDFYDIHSALAVASFRLNCGPTKKELERIGQKGLRVGAKNVVFGSLYGRKPPAISRQCREENKDVSPRQAAQLQEYFFGLYSGILPFQQACAARVGAGWMKNPFGRFRRFIPTDDREAAGELERQAMNFIAQSTVADAVSISMRHLMHHPRRVELGYRICLQIHDAVLLEVPVRSVQTVYEEILPQCMHDWVSFKSCDLEGRPYANSPDFQFSIDVKAMPAWGERLTVDACQAIGLDKKYAA